MIAIEREANEKLSIELQRQMKTDKQGGMLDEENKSEQGTDTHSLETAKLQLRASQVQRIIQSMEDTDSDFTNRLTVGS